MHGVLTDIVVVMVVAIVAAFLLRRLHVPPVVGFILAGVAIGPAGLGLVADRHKIEVVAEVGVMLLLFMVGLKISLRNLWRMRAVVLGGGALQYCASAAALAVAVRLAGLPWPEAVGWGLAAGLSSTALVLWLFEDRGETGTEVGRASIGVLLFQDLAVIPVMLTLPLLAGRAGSGRDVALVAGESVAVVIGTIVAARVVVPWLLARVVATRSRELFTLTIVLVALGTAVLLSGFGISMALGAFIAGMVVSESEYVAQIVADITPLRDVFNSLFFVSVGMLVDLRVWAERPGLALGLVVAVVVGKGAIAALALLPATGSAATAVGAGLSLAQVGELAVVVVAAMSSLGMAAGDRVGLFLAVAVPTMALTPLLMWAGRPLARRLERRGSGRGGPVATRAALGLRDHVVVVGFGVNGRNVARALAGIRVPHVVVDLNAVSLSEVEGDVGRALYGDGRREAVLVAAGLERARALIVAIADATATREVVAVARRLSPEVMILARTRYVLETEPLLKLGANQVIPEEFETSLELTGRVLRLYGASETAVLREKTSLREAHYGLLRGEPTRFDRPTLEGLLGAADLETVVVEPGSEAEGCSIRGLGVRERTGATVVGLVRGDDVRPNPSAGLELAAGDGLVVWGTAEQAEEVRRLTSAS